MSKSATTSAKKTTLTASMLVDVFGVSVIVRGNYSNELTTLSCVADISAQGETLKAHFKKAVPSDWDYVLDKIDLQNIEVAVQFSQKDGLQYYSIGTTVLVDGRKIAFQLFKRADTLLVSMHLAGLIPFKSLPLVGEYLKEEDGINDLQVMYYKSENDTPAFLVNPAALLKYPEKKSAIKEGVNIFARVQIGDQQMPLAFPLEAIEDVNNSKAELTAPPESANAQLPANSGQPKKNFLDVRKFELQYDKQKIGFLISGAVNISVFELEVMGLKVSAPLDILGNFHINKFSFDLEGLSLDISKPPLLITGAFLRVKTPGAADDYFGLMRVSFKQFQLTAIGAYSKTEDYTSIFIFAFVGMPMGGPPFFFVTGLAFGFGINRDFILPDISKISSFPLVRMCADSSGAPKADTKEGVLEAMRSLGSAIPPNVGSYFIVAGIRFESFRIIKTLALAVVKFGNELEVTLLGISSLTLPSIYVELAFSVQFAPAKGIIMARGVLTSNSYLLLPEAKLTGGFAVGFWFAGDNSGDFVISIGGYHPRFRVPPHFPDNIPRIGLFAKLGDSVTLSGGLYFALTPQAIMAGMTATVVYNDGTLYASISLRADFIILWKPFYYEANIGVEVYVKFKIGVGFLSKTFDFNLNAGLEIWGPDFSGRALLDAGIKTFKIGFGANAPKYAPPLNWQQFFTEFIPEKPCVITVGGGLISKVNYIPNGETTVFECWIINPTELVLTTDSAIPASEAYFGSTKIDTSGIGSTGVAPMRNQQFEARHSVLIYKNQAATKQLIEKNDAKNCKFEIATCTKNLPKAIWGTSTPNSNEPPASDDSLVKKALTGIEVYPKMILGGSTSELTANDLAYQTDLHPGKFQFPKIATNTTTNEGDIAESHQRYTKARAARVKSIKALQEFLPDIALDLSDIEGSIPVYTFTEPFIETECIIN